MKLTKRTLDALSCPPGKKDVLFFDDDLKGFGVRITGGGAKVFLFQYRANGRVRRSVIGDYGPLTPAEARIAAQQLRATVSGGGDPIAIREATQRDEAERLRIQGLTLGKLSEAWRVAKASQRREKPLHAAVQVLRHHLAPWWDKPAASVTGDDLAGVLSSLVERGSLGAAMNVHRVGRTVFNWAVGARKLPRTPFAGLAAPGRDTRRDRVLSDPELGELWRVAAAMPYPWGPWTQMMVLTLQRREQVAGMRWSELDSDLAEWSIPPGRAKNKRPHQVHLTDTARAILQAVPRRKDCDLVFTTNGTAPISGWSKHNRAVKLAIAEERVAIAGRGAKIAPMPDWVLHDLRRTGVTAMARLGVPPHVADKILSHEAGTISGVAAVYQRFEFLEERRRAMFAWDGYVHAAAEGRDPMAAAEPTDAKVIPLPSGARRRPRRE